MLTRVNHIALAVADVEATLALYRDALGLTVTEDVVVDGRRTVTLPAGGSALVLREAGGPDAGIDYLAFDADIAEPQRPDREDTLGLGIVLLPRPPDPGPPERRGRVECIDHVVISSNDSGRCAAFFEERFGLELKRKMVRPGTNALLAFAKLGDVVLEFAGPPEPLPGELRAKLWGLVLTVDDIDAVVAEVRAKGYEASEPKPAVQPGAKIAGVKRGTGGVPFALIQYNAL